MNILIRFSCVLGVITLLSLFTVACSDDDETIQQPTLNSFTPTSGPVGTTVIITGTNFSTTASANQVTFNGSAATVSAATATQLTVTVPTVATTGKIAVTVNNKTATSDDDFTVTTTSVGAPAITSFTPSSGTTGTTITITGTDFSATAASNTVAFNGTAATVSAASSTQLIVTVPTGATTGKISVNVDGNTATSTSDFTVTTSSTSDCGTATTQVEKIVCLCNAFKATLTSSQISTLQIAFNKTNAIKWSNLPGGVSIRNGLEFSTLTSSQLVAAKEIIAAAAGTTSDEGYSEFLQINAADNVLGTKAGSAYSSGEYIIAFLGTPSTTDTWMLQFGGHHYAQNITYNAGTVQGTTPSHQGIEPTSWTTSGTTYAPLKTEQEVMAAMLAGLTSGELASAKLSSTFSDVSLGPNEDGQFPTTKVGLKVSALSSTQKALVVAAMKPWLQDVDDVSGAAMLAIYESELDDTYIAYSGNATLTNHADYVRIDGPSVWIEFVCQNGVVYTEIHYHAVYRDHTRDYGGNFTF